MAGVPPKKNEAFTLYVVVVSQADTDTFQVNPTIAAGDFQVSTDDGAFGNPTTLPVVDPAASRQIKIVLSPGEMNGDVMTIIGSDQAGDEWCDVFVQIFTDTAQMGELDDDAITAAKIAVNAIGASELAADAVAEIHAGLMTLGAGTTPLEVTVTDGVNPLDGAEVDVTTTAAHTGPVASGYTDAFGKVTFHLDPGTYYIWVQHSGYNGPNPTAKVIP